MTEEIWLCPILYLEDDDETIATEKIYDLMKNAGIEIRGWKHP